MIRNVIFDIGNVLVDFCWREHIESCGFQGVTADRIGRAMMQSPVWSEIDRGVWSMEELLLSPTIRRSGTRSVSYSGISVRW